MTEDIQAFDIYANIIKAVEHLEEKEREQKIKNITRDINDYMFSIIDKSPLRLCESEIDDDFKTTMLTAIMAEEKVICVTGTADDIESKVKAFRLIQSNAFHAVAKNNGFIKLWLTDISGALVDQPEKGFVFISENSDHYEEQAQVFGFQQNDLLTFCIVPELIKVINPYLDVSKLPEKIDEELKRIIDEHVR